MTAEFVEAVLTDTKHDGTMQFSAIDAEDNPVILLVKDAGCKPCRGR